MLLLALGLTVLTAVVWRTPVACASVAAGGLLAFLNMVVLRRTARALLTGSARTQTLFAVILVLKMGLLLCAVYGAVRWLGLAPIGLIIGTSALVLGVVAAALVRTRDGAGSLQPER